MRPGSTHGARHPMSSLHEQVRHIYIRSDLIFFFVLIIFSTVTGPLTCTRHHCVSSLLMPLIRVTLCHYYYWSSAPITGYHWGSFIPPCNQGQFVTMSNEKMPVSSGWYLPITRCLTASWLPCTIAPHDTLRLRRFILAHSRFKNRTRHFLRTAKGENKKIYNFTLIVGLQKIIKVNWSRLFHPAVLSHF